LSVGPGRSVGLVSRRAWAWEAASAACSTWERLDRALRPEPAIRGRAAQQLIPPCALLLRVRYEGAVRPGARALARRLTCISASKPGTSAPPRSSIRPPSCSSTRLAARDHDRCTPTPPANANRALGSRCSRITKLTLEITESS
jgi:hypothetical protein